jgi:hypothetical protein
MAERVAGIGAWDAEDEQALVSAISYDDPLLPASRFHSSETVKPAPWRVSSSTKTIGSFLASVISSVKMETLDGTNSALPGPPIAPVSLLGPPRG